ncbi:Sulfurtransferase TusA [Marinomonas aquimarina]|uniref:Sulfurtransferase TusA n=1 Tax=Marinomonas aquimarina TaxID=295068 RepID=A0A1A8TGX1_9GAMM|nr:sulfurtransferase TusA family protein [Marinomonas aquimarina]SBS31871.1 Sulfurtransferase TusA [Marinomonas aquimarina]
MLNVQQYDVILDAKEDRCPMPLLKLKLALAKMAVGETICVYATDEGSLKDIPHFLALVGLPLVEQGEQDSIFHFVIRKQES